MKKIIGKFTQETIQLNPLMKQSKDINGKRPVLQNNNGQQDILYLKRFKYNKIDNKPINKREANKLLKDFVNQPTLNKLRAKYDVKYKVDGYYKEKGTYFTTSDNFIRIEPDLETYNIFDRTETLYDNCEIIEDYDNYSDDLEFQSFYITVMLTDKAGYDSPGGDCFINCLRAFKICCDYIPGVKNYIIEHAPHLRTPLLQNKFYIKDINIIEKLFNVSINIISSEITNYKTSKPNNLIKYYIKYENNHFSPIFFNEEKALDKPLNIPKLFSMYNKRYKQGPRPIMIYKRDKNILKTYSNEGYAEYDYSYMKQLQKIYCFFNYDSVKRYDIENINNFDEKHLNNVYNKLCLDIDEAEQITKVNIKCFKDLSEAVHMKINDILYNQMTLYIDDIDYIEYKILEEASYGGIRRNIPGVYSNVYSYDINDAYYGILNNKKLDFYIPIKKYTPRYYDPKYFNNIIKKELLYGIYKCKISNPNNKKNMFIYNDNMYYYTHYDILNAYKQGLQIDLIDETPNAFVWFKAGANKNLIKSYDIFNSYIEHSLKLKYEYKNNKILKTMMSGCWGMLCEKVITYSEVKDNNFIMKRKYNVYGMTTAGSDENFIMLKSIKSEQPYQGDLARLKPFILSYLRYILADYFYKYLDDIIYINTDGVITKNIINEYENHKKIKKDMKYSNKNIKIINNNVIQILEHL